MHHLLMCAKHMLAVDIDLENNWFSNLIKPRHTRQSKTIRHLGKEIILKMTACTFRSLVSMHINSGKICETHIQFIVMSRYVDTVFSSIQRLIWLILWYGESIWRWVLLLKPCAWCFMDYQQGCFSSIAYYSVIANWQIPNRIAHSTSHLLAIFIWIDISTISKRTEISTRLGLNTTRFVVFILYGKVESYHMNVCYTLSFIIKSNIGAETRELSHEDACALVRRQSHYFRNASEVMLANMIRFDNKPQQRTHCWHS